jgi:acyl-CoA thioester hydrolase
MKQPPLNCSVAIEIPVAWSDMDAFQHVNSTAYFRYMESGRVAYFDRIRLLEYLRETGVGPILASTSCRFLAPLTYPDTVSVGTRVSRMGQDRFTMETMVFSHCRDQVVAQGASTVVIFNYHKQRKTQIPARIRRRIAELETPFHRYLVASRDRGR